MNVTRSDEIAASVQAVAERGAIDILMNNAGIPSSSLALEDESDDNWRRMIGTKLSNLFYFAKPVARKMIAQGQGATSLAWRPLAA